LLAVKKLGCHPGFAVRAHCRCGISAICLTSGRDPIISAALSLRECQFEIQSV
jgi:hypothetical protein